MIQVAFDRPIQTVKAISAAYGINRTTITQAIHRGLLGEAVYKSGDIWLIDTQHQDFRRWLDAHWQQARVKGRLTREPDQQGNPEALPERVS